MARNFGKLFVSIWSDEDFIARSCGAQRLYMFLISQPDLTSVGTLTLALNRWSTRVDDLSREDILRHLFELVQAGFVIVDEQCEELLVRSYMRRDEGWKSPNVMMGIRSTAKNVMSETIRAVLREEVSKIDTSNLPTKINEKTQRSTKDAIEATITEMLDDLKGFTKDSGVIGWNPFQATLEGFPGVEINPSPKGSVGGFLTTTPTPPPTPNPITTPTVEKSTFDVFYDIYPRKAKRGDAEKAWGQALERGIHPQTIIDGARRLANDPNLPTGDDRKFIPYPATWIRADGWDDEPLPPRRSQQAQSTTDDRVQGWLDIAQQAAYPQAMPQQQLGIES